MKIRTLSILSLTWLTACTFSNESALKKGLLPDEDFEHGLQKWDVNNPEKIRIVASGNDDHGNVLEMHPGSSNTFILMKGSKDLTNVKIEGDVLFPEYEHNYLGIIYNYNVKSIRADYGCIYIKGNSSYLRVNPHRDGNVSRIIYDEYKTNLTGTDTIRIGKWQHFKMEVSGPVSHIYVGDMQAPKITFDFHEYSSGRIGFEPRVTGSHVWIDNITVQPIDKLSYEGPMQPERIVYEPDSLLTEWMVAGPFRDLIENQESTNFESNEEINWVSFQADGRGCVVTGRILEWTSLKNYAYFSTNIESPQALPAFLELSTTNALKVWLNGQLVGEVDRQFKAWYDFYKNESHAGHKLPIRLTSGKNKVIVRVSALGWEGYAGDGFFAKITNN